MRVYVMVLVTLAGLLCLSQDSTLFAATPELASSSLDSKAQYRNGDANGDFAIDISDAVFILSYTFSGGQPPNPLAAGDLNCDTAVDISDAVYLIDRIFGGGPAPCPSSPPWGETTFITECKPAGSKLDTDSANYVPDCIYYEYDGSCILKLIHINAAFNCCGIITSAAVLNGNNIDIYVWEDFESYPCPCLCLYDLTYQLVNLPPGEYNIRVQEMYVQTGDPSVNCTVDLSGPTSGLNCVERTHYPWME